MEQCKRHPEVKVIVGTPCLKCRAEMEEVQASRYSNFRKLLDKLLNRKDNSMKNVFTREIRAKFEDLEAAGCIITEKDTGRELFKVVVWPKDKIDPTVSSRSTQSLSVSEFVVRYVEGGIHPVALEVKLASLQVPYMVRAYDPSKVDGPVNTAAPGKPIPVVEGVIGLTPAQQAIRDRQAAQLLSDPIVTRVLTVSVTALDLAGFSFIGGQRGMKVMLKDVKDASVTPEQILDDDLGRHLTFTFTGKRSPFERELGKYRVNHSVVRDVEYPQPKPEPKVASIQVAATRQSADRFEVVGENAIDRTHWSVYLRDKEGLVTHVEDYKISGFGGPARADALQHAAALSMEHQVPIEPIP